MSDQPNASSLDDHDIDAERGIPSVNRSGSKGSKSNLVMILFAIVAAVALVAVNGGFSSKEEQVEKSKRMIRSSLPPLIPPAPPAPKKEKPAPSPAPAPVPIVAVKKNEPVPIPTMPPRNERRGKKKKTLTPEERRRLAPIFSDKNGKGSGGSSSSAQVASVDTSSGRTLLGGGDKADGIKARLSASRLSGARASLITAPSFMVTKGTFLDCVLETALSSDVPGMTACRLTRDVYSTNGKLLLIERGSRIVGEYRSNLMRGHARLFVIWSRIETPNGVIVNLNSPGTGPLGRSGLSGFIDRHFWERFGAAMLLSLIDDVGTYAASKSNDSNGDNIQFNSTTETTEDMASIVLKDSVKIKPTLVKNQGDHINIFVARDLDFRGVYDVELTD